MKMEMEHNTMHLLYERFCGKKIIRKTLHCIESNRIESNRVARLQQQQQQKNNIIRTIHVVSYFSSVLDRKEEIHPSEHRSTNLLYMLFLFSRYRIE